MKGDFGHIVLGADLEGRPRRPVPKLLEILIVEDNERVVLHVEFLALNLDEILEKAEGDEGKATEDLEVATDDLDAAEALLELAHDVLTLADRDLEVATDVGATAELLGRGDAVHNRARTLLQTGTLALLARPQVCYESTESFLLYIMRTRNFPTLILIIRLILYEPFSLTSS